ncbi:MAG: thiosulfate oxidation carrier protein SoxY [Rhodobacteraceae bacterium]|nr:thiosulfate oxidation carrier protein SoxY [Paracoccaceae bacterium]
MNISRRHVLAVGSAGLAVTLLPMPAQAAVDAGELIARFTGGAAPVDGPLTITAPQIAENGNAVGVEVACPGAKSIRILAPANPNPEVCTVHFGPRAGSHMLSTRIRMAETMDVIALAEMEDGSFVQASARVRVTIGGCGG